MKRITIEALKSKIIWFKFVSLIILILVVRFLVPNSESHHFNLLSNPGVIVFINTNNTSDNELEKARTFVNQVLGTALNLDSYDVCFSSAGDTYRNNGQDNTKLIINILPIESNISIRTTKLWAKDIFLYEPSNPLADAEMDQIVKKVVVLNSDGTLINDIDQNEPGVLDKNIQASLAVNPDGSSSCQNISVKENGFFYAGNIYLEEQSFNKNTQKYSNNETRLSLSSSDPIHLSAADLEIKTNYYALYGKRIALFLLLVGFIVSVWKILHFTVKK